MAINDPFERALRVKSTKRPAEPRALPSDLPALPADLPKLPEDREDAFDDVEAPRLAAAPQVSSEHDRGVAGAACVATLAVAGIVIAAGAGLVWYFWPQFTELTFHAGVVALIFGAAMLIYGLVIAFSVWHVRVTPQGLTWRDRKGTHQCAWDDITAVYRTERYIANTAQRVTELRVESAGNHALVVSHALSDYEQLAEAIQTITTELLLPKKRAELAQGEARFGSVTVRRDGICIGRKDLAWEQIDHYFVDNGHVVFFRKDSRHIHDSHLFQLAEVPNYLILLQLLEDLGQYPIPSEESDRIMLARG